ncbi:asparagine synthase (glutamine-hydrolyzing) [Fundidesulfovibrio terrae]|uniref:asparagine synthase (glutamine-hydrolyzing) n=1 Tax=Fundidesulfovibrio terrae TaxID=2922866 RepID=UPI002435B991|nr:asparagine synthase (glutamine-hydrolyzing) [Fundidesulfovibrio terrae]
MCGIAGIYDFSGPVAAEALVRFTDSLAHRGPDGKGTHLDGPIGLGHRRLAILDLSEAGANPMRYAGPDGREFWISYNGEVYNFLELRAELEALGHRFRTDTDTEVIAAAYAQWGDACQERFNGMWAFALWDPLERSLFLSRDRFSIKPLYYLDQGRRFCFASELKAFPELDGYDPECNESLVPMLLASPGAYEGTTTQTLFAGVHRLPGGHCLRVGPDGTRTVRRWWNTHDHIPEIPGRYEEQVERFRELFFDAVRIRMRSDVAVGTCLSGGVDSSAVASAMAWLQGHRPDHDLGRCPEDWQRTYIATFPGTMIDEREYADEVVRHVGARPSYWTFEPREALDNVLESTWAMEEVYNGIAVPGWALYREMRRGGTKVSLDGHGGDELLCGYTWYLDFPMNEVNARIEADFHTNLLPAILRNYDRCSMAHGIEVRMPIMDWRLVTFCMGLPARSKIGEGYTKRIFRDALRGIMPEKNRTRLSKFGFNSPMIEWFNGGLAPLIEQVTSSPMFLESPHWDGPALRARIVDKTSNKAWTMADWGETLNVWTRMNVVLWQMMFITRDIVVTR